MKNKQYIHNQIKLKYYDISFFLDFNNKDEIIELVYYILEDCYYLNLRMILYSSIATLKRLNKDDWKKIINKINKQNIEDYQEEYHVCLNRFIWFIEENCFVDKSFLLFIGLPRSLVEESTQKFHSHNSSRLVNGFLGPLTSTQQKIKKIRTNTLPNLTYQENEILYYMFTDCLNIKNKKLEQACKKAKVSCA